MILVYLAVGWVSGITLAALLALPTALWLWLLVLPIGYLVIWWRDLDLRRVHFVYLAVILGALRYQLAVPAPADNALTQFNDQGRASLVGVVAAEPDQRDAYTNLRVDVGKIQRGGVWYSVQGRALVQAPRDTPARYGDEIQVEGEPTTPPSGADFSYRDFLARESVFTFVRRAQVYVVSHEHGNPLWARLLDFKALALASVKTIMPEPAAALLSGILLGHDQEIPRALKDAFSQTNTAHIIAISGFNISILAVYLGMIARRAVGVRRADFLVIAALGIYTLLVGANASVVRAAIMGSLGVIAQRYGRTTFAFNSLAVAGFLMTLLNPLALWDVGFQLSFLATLGLVLYTQRMSAWTERMLKRVLRDERAKKVVALFGDSLIVTIAAQFTTTPLIVAIFHRLSLVGLLTNLLVLPVQPFIMILGGLATLTRMLATALAFIPFAETIVGGLAQTLGWGAWLFLQYTILVVEWTARVPFASVEVPRVDWMLVIIIYILIFVVTRFSLRQVTGVFFSRPVWAATLVAFISIFVWTSTLAAPDPRTHLQFIATTSGDAIFIRTADGARILIDGSAEPSALLGHLGGQLTFWEQRLDLLVVTNWDEQNLASLNAVLERYSVGQVLTPAPRERGGASYQKWSELLAQKNLAPITAQAGAHLQIDEVTLDVVYPLDDAPNANVALRLAAGAHVFLIAPTLKSRDLAELVGASADLRAQVAVLPREFDAALLQRVAPRTVVLFVGKSSREQPAPDALKLLAGIDLLRTDARGTLEFIVSGDEMELHAER